MNSFRLLCRMCAMGLSLLLGIACTGLRMPVDMSSLDSSRDQDAIAALYSDQAGSLRQKAETLRQQAVVYAHLFGPDSEWVRGARLLATYYEDAAQESERQAGKHIGLLPRK